jgi:hypothetical protein
MKKEESDKMMFEVLNEFVDYTRIMPSYLEHLNKLGLLSFMKFKLGMTSSLLNRAKKNPTSVATFLGLQELLGVDIDNAYNSLGSSLSNRIIDPLDSLEGVLSPISWDVVDRIVF